MTSVVQSFLWDGIKFPCVFFFFLGFFSMPVLVHDQQCMRKTTSVGQERTRDRSFLRKHMKPKITLGRIQQLLGTQSQSYCIFWSEGAGLPNTQNPLQSEMQCTPC